MLPSHNLFFQFTCSPPIPFTILHCEYHVSPPKGSFSNLSHPQEEKCMGIEYMLKVTQKIHTCLKTLKILCCCIPDCELKQITLLAPSFTLSSIQVSFKRHPGYHDHKFPPPRFTPSPVGGNGGEREVGRECDRVVSLVSHLWGDACTHKQSVYKLVLSQSARLCVYQSE